MCSACVFLQIYEDVFETWGHSVHMRVRTQFWDKINLFFESEEVYCVVVVVLMTINVKKSVCVCVCVCVRLDSAFWEQASCPLWYILICLLGQRKKLGSAAEMCFPSRVHFLSVCAGGVGCPPTAATGMFVVKCLQALSQTQFSGRPALNWWNLKQWKQMKNMPIFFFSWTFTTPASASCSQSQTTDNRKE